MQNPAPQHDAFPSIESYKKAKKQLCLLRTTRSDGPFPLPDTLTLRGTVKLHGTHADIVYEPGKDGSSQPYISFQSRNRVVRNAKDQDNCGFVRHMEEEVTL